MNEKGANIDLLFRNGLKDFEVLPPPEVWDGIRPVVKLRSRPFISLKVAAMITVLLTVSFFTYRWSREISAIPEGSIVAFNVEASAPVISMPDNNPRNLQDIKYDQIKNLPVLLTDYSNTAGIIQEIETDDSPEEVTFVQNTRSLSIINNKTVSGPFLRSFNASHETAIKIREPELQYFQENIRAKPQNRWSIAALASPTYYSSFNSGNDGISKQLMESEQPLFSYSGGVALSYKITKRLSIQSGLYYSALGQKVEGINSFSGFKPYDNAKGVDNFQVLTTSGTIHTSNPDVFLNAVGSNRLITEFTNDVIDPKKANLQPVNTSLNQSLSYLELPVVLRYKVLDRTIGINLIGGVSYNLLVTNSVYTSLDGNKYPVGDTKGLNPLTLSSSLGMGMEYKVSDKLSLNFEPTFRYYINPFSVTTGSYTHPYSFGIFSGLSYKF
jgi:hypothetical protein